MPDTLKARLERLRPLKESAREFGIKTLDREVSDAERRVLSEFFNGDPLASNVARGIDSYETRIVPIEEMYSTLWRRLRVPHLDPPFDQEIRRVLGSINSVGEVCVDPEILTTEGRRRGFIRLNEAGLFMGGLMGLLVWTMATDKPYNPEVENIITHTINAYCHYLSAAFPIVSIGGLAPPRLLNSQLKPLKSYAEATDSFLRQYHV